ncbi:hypothetical protein ACFQY4_02100 [Catellatospora bangladeshensis]|uniref:hypothetical protein n=1 Tax=Catellatospora bangladeshensis TaxID=310355 RepID=UPI00361B107E
MVGLWAVAVAVASQFGLVLTGQVLGQLGMELPGLLWPLTGLLALLVAGIPAWLLSRLPRHPGVRAVGAAFGLGAIALGVGSALRIVPASANELYLLCYAILAGGGAYLRYRRTGAATAAGGPATAAAAPAAPLPSGPRRPRRATLPAPAALLCTPIRTMRIRARSRADRSPGHWGGRWSAACWCSRRSFGPGRWAG